MSGHPGLFSEPLSPTVAPRLFAGSPDYPATTAPEARSADTTALDFGPDAYMIDLYERAPDPSDPLQLRDLYLGRVEDTLGARSTRPELAEAWRGSRRRRRVDPDDILTSRATVRFTKEMFNFYFRDDLYGSLRSPDSLILSSGSVDEEEWGLPTAIKRCITYALTRDWYGYSDSRGREPAREAIAAYESSRLSGASYDLRHVALTMGGTFAINSVADFVLTGRTTTAPVLCGIPNYPPLVEAMARRAPVRLVPTPSVAGVTSIGPVIEQLRLDTPLVLLQTAANPTGSLIVEDELETLIRRASRSTIILLDECHEWLGPRQRFSDTRAAENVIRVSSLSKNWSAPGLKIGWFLASAAFIDEYYEYASSSFGGPPSFFYTAIEVIARMERWRLEGRESTGPRELAEFESGYGLTETALHEAYASYLAEREARERALIGLRDITISRLRLPDTKVAAARYSINLAIRLRDYADGYVVFRDLLDRHGVSVFPGLLTFCLAGGVVRITTARRWSDLSVALDRIEEFRRAGRAAPSLTAER